MKEKINSRILKLQSDIEVWEKDINATWGSHVTQIDKDKARAVVKAKKSEILFLESLLQDLVD